MRARRLLPPAVAVAALLAAAPPAAAQDDDPPPSIERPGVDVEEIPGTATITAAPTATTMFVGAGSSTDAQPGQAVTVTSIDEFQQQVEDPSAALSGGVDQFFEQGGETAVVQLLTDESPASLLAAVSGPVAGQSGWDMLVVPAMGGLDPASWTQLAEAMGTAAATAQGVALLDPPSSIVQAGDTGWAAALAATTAPLQQSVAASSMAVLSSPLVVEGQVVSSAAVFAGMNAKKDVDAGVWVPPGGPGQPLAGMTPVVVADNDDADVLHGGGINPIMSLPGVGTVVFGDRTLSTASGAGVYLSAQRTLDMIRDSIDVGLRPFVFEQAGPQTWAAATQSISGFLTTLWQGGALQGDDADQAFTVTVGDASASPDEIAEGEMVVDVTVSLVPDQPTPLRFTQQVQSGP